MDLIRSARRVSAAAVAGIAAWSSWSHMVHVALRFGERAEVAYVLPVSVDGMLVVASTAMVEDQRAGRAVRWSARVAFAAGVAASVAANIAAAKPTLGARIVAAWPALALLLVVEILTKAQTVGRLPRGEGASADDEVPPRNEPLPSARTGLAVPDPRDGRRYSAAGNADAEVDEGEPPAPPPRRQTTEPTARRHGGGRSERAAHVVARLRTERPQASLAELASAAQVSQRHVRRLLAEESGNSEAVQTMTISEQHMPGGIQ
jgi:hypothetical protein